MLLVLGSHFEKQGSGTVGAVQNNFAQRWAYSAAVQYGGREP